MRANRLRQLLNAGEPSIGTHVMIPWPGIAEIVGRAGGFDYMEFSGSYAPFDLHLLENFGRAVELFDNFTAMMKIEQEPRTFIAERAIGAGIQNVLFADVRSVEEAEECVSAVRADTPQTGGRFGAEGRRFAGYVVEGGSPAYVQALDDSVVALMIEKETAVNDLEAILSVRGVDMVQFGPTDYAMNTGKVGRPKDPEVREIQEHVIKTALKMGVHPRAEVASAEQAKRFLDLGVRHFSIGADLSVIYQWWRENGQALREVIDKGA